MTALRRLLRLCPMLVLAGVVLALALRLLVPTGYMPAVGADGAVRIVLCPDYAPVPARAMAHGHAMAASHHDAGHGGGEHGGAKEQPCAFAGLSLPTLGATDAALLAVAVAIAMVLAQRRPVARAPAAIAFLRPPLRGPPLPA